MSEEIVLKKPDDLEKQDEIEEKKIIGEKRDREVLEKQEAVDIEKKRQALRELNMNKLKEKCRNENLRVSGRKDVLIERLLHPNDHRKKNKSTGQRKKTRRGTLRTQTVDKQLEELGLVAGRISSCVKKGIQRNLIRLVGMEKPLEQVVYSGNCCYCSKEVSVKLNDVLYQGDYGGDYEDGSDGAGWECPHCEGKAYLTDVCSGRGMSLDSGKFYNHCTECKGFGICIGDYRESHCGKCGKHYFQGLSGFDCPHCERRSGGGMGMGGMNGCLLM